MLKCVVKPALVLALAGLVLNGCGKKDSDDDDPETKKPSTPVGTGTNDDGTVTVTGTLALGASLTTSSLADLIFYCMTFESTPVATSSAFDDDGGFSIEIKANTPFGCFVNNKTTNKTVATVVIDSGETGGMGGSSSSMALAGGVDFGALTIGADGTIKVPAATLTAVKTEAPATLDLDDLHNATYKMTCTGSGSIYDSCMENLADGDGEMTVMFRILKGKKGTTDISGLGVWENKAAFDACGGFDMTAAESASIAEEDGMTFTQNSVGTFVADDTACPKRDTDDPKDSDNIQKYYMLGRLVAIPGGYSIFDEDSGSKGNCTYSNSTAIDFSGTSEEFYGAFTSKDYRSADCGDQSSRSDNSVFSVKFVKQ
jgi:hypothetical protein